MKFLFIWLMLLSGCSKPEVCPDGSLNGYLIHSLDDKVSAFCEDVMGNDLGFIGTNCYFSGKRVAHKLYMIEGMVSRTKCYNTGGIKL